MIQSDRHIIDNLIWKNEKINSIHHIVCTLYFLGENGYRYRILILHPIPIQ